MLGAKVVGRGVRKSGSALVGPTNSKSCCVSTVLSALRTDRNQGRCSAYRPGPRNAHTPKPASWVAVTANRRSARSSTSSSNVIIKRYPKPLPRRLPATVPWTHGTTTRWLAAAGADVWCGGRQRVLPSGDHAFGGRGLRRAGADRDERRHRDAAGLCVRHLLP